MTPKEIAYWRAYRDAAIAALPPVDEAAEREVSRLLRDRVAATTIRKIKPKRTP